MLRNIPEERRPHLHRGGSLQSVKFNAVLHKNVKVKVQQSRNRPGVAQRVPEVLGSQIS